MSDTQPVEPQLDLTDKQKMFIDQYFICGFNGTEAARRAGYAGNENVLGVVAYDNLRNPKIKAEIDRRMAEFHLTANEVLARLSMMATGSMEDFLAGSGRGVKLDLARAKRNGKLNLVKSFTKGKQGTKIELYDAQAALVQLGKHLKLFTEHIDLTSGGEKLQPDDRYNTAISSLADALREIIPGAGAQPDGGLDPAEQTPMAGAPVESG